MKNVLRFLFVVLMFGIYASASAQTASELAADFTPEEARQTIAEALVDINAECPEKLDENLFLIAVKMNTNDLVMTFSALEDDETIKVMETMKDELGQMMYKELMEDESSRFLFSLCKIAKLNLKFVFTNGNGVSAVMVIPYTKM